MSQKTCLISLDAQKDRLKVATVCKAPCKMPPMQQKIISGTQTLGDILTEYKRGLQMASQRSQAIAAKIKHSVVPKVIKRNICAAHPRQEIVLFSDRKLTNMLGVITEEQQASKNDKALRKQYIGLWSRESMMTNKTNPKFPIE